MTNGFSQRIYRSSSVLASGNWFKIATKEPGVYKVDVALLRALGLNISGISSASIRLYGNGGNMLPEACSGDVTDDLNENAIHMADGGDGIFNGTDYFLFYSSGPDIWNKDSINRRFTHQKNIYSEQSYYFITVEGTGKRISSVKNSAVPSRIITTYNDRYFHELDAVNLLTSGKEWLGEEFANTPGKTITRQFALPVNGSISADPAVIVSDCISRSVNGSSRFSVTVNNTSVLSHHITAVGTGNLDVYARNSVLIGSFIPSPAISISYTYEPGGNGAQGWLNWFEVFTKKSMTLSGVNQLLFRDWNSVGAGLTGEFKLSSAGAATRVWDITNPATPSEVSVHLSGTELKFVQDCSTLHEYVAFNNTGFLTPDAIGKISNQNLHAVTPARLVIVTHPALLEAARRLANHHLNYDRMNVAVVTTSQVYNEFSSGSSDPTAIRDYIKMLYDKAGNDTTRRPAYLLLFGDASYDYKSRLPDNTNLVPAYQSRQSLDPLTTYASDDYFGFLEDHEDINSLAVNTLDIGIGRIPAKNIAEANAYADKVISYTGRESLGPWRNQLTFIADDEDFNLHMQDAENVTGSAAAANQNFIQNKLYLDAFQQEGNASGSRYPEVNLAINNQVNKGTLIWNYNGHGSFRRLAEEVVLDQEMVKSWNNSSRLSLFITATCDFAPYDNPAIYSLGEDILLRPKTGAIALMTTTRLVFAFSNRIMNRNYLLTALQQKADGSYLSLGEAVKRTKNITYLSQGDMINNRKFTLLGDPALTLAFPKYRVKTTAINGVPVQAFTDTLKALQRYTISGSVTGENGITLTDFNGTVNATVYDKMESKKTLANDATSVQQDFKVQQNKLCQSKTTVKNGKFNFSFVVPADINYQPGYAKISYYADNGRDDANGSFTDLVVGGSQGISIDKEGPQIKAYLDSIIFINGSITGNHPVLFINLSDTSGINIVGTGIGHDITAMLDNDPRKIFKLNDFFEAVENIDDAGTIRFPLPELEEGSHSLKVKAWDGANNSNEVVLTFRVVNKSFQITRTINFPNPVDAATTFRFEHDLEKQDIEVAIRIFSASGRLVKSIERTINTQGNRSCDIEWDGKNDHGAGIKTGIYIYFIQVKKRHGIKVQKAGKLIMK